jgi:hypothetical protein
MGKPSKQQIAEARKRGIVPGARIKCASGIGGGILRPSGDWTSENEGFHDGVNWCVLNNVWATVIAAPAKPKDQPDRIKQIELDVNRHGVALATAVDRIEGYLNKLGQAVVDQGREFKSKLSAIESSVAVIRSGATFMQQLERDAPSMRELIQAELRSISERLDALRMEQSALAQDTAIDPLMNNGIVEPQPASLQPGDYCDASKEVADELTAMGFEWLQPFVGHSYIRQSTTSATQMTNATALAPYAKHLDRPTFLSRARVTAKELGLKPVEAPAELNVGDWVEVIAPAGASDIIGCDRYRGTIAQVEPWSTYATKEKAFHIRSIDCWFRASSLRKLSEAEIAAHLAAEEAKRKEAERPRR